MFANRRWGNDIPHLHIIVVWVSARNSVSGFERSLRKIVVDVIEVDVLTHLEAVRPEGDFHLIHDL
jgi:hypothetical protein